MKKYWILLFLMVVAGSLKAQVNFGFGGSVLKSNIDSRSNKTGTRPVFDFKDQRSWKIGGTAIVPVSGRLIFMPQLNLVRKGGRINQTFYYDREDGHPGFVAVEGYAKFTYMEWPLNVVYVTHYESGFYIGAGPFIGYGLGGKIKCRIANTNLSLLPVEKSWYSYQDKVIFDGKEGEQYPVKNYVRYKSWEAGVNFIAGYRFNNGLFINAQWNKALSDMEPDSGLDIKNRYYGMGITYFMGSHTPRVSKICTYKGCK